MIVWLGGVGGCVKMCGDGCVVMDVCDEDV